MTSLDIIAARIFVIAMCEVIVTTLTVPDYFDGKNEEEDGVE